MLEKYREELYRCCNCGYCRESYTDYRDLYLVCPVRERLKWVSHTLMGLCAIGRGILDGKLTYNERLIKHIFTDLHCGLCSTICSAGIDIHPIIEAMRSDIVEKKLKLPDGVEAFFKGLRDGHNIFGESADKRGEWAKEIRVSPKAELVYFVGCLASYKHQEIAKATGKILNALGVEFNILGEKEWCCGNRSLVSGNIGMWKAMASHNFKVLKEMNAKKVVFTCAEGYSNFKYAYPKFLEKFDLEVIHISEILSDQHKKGKIRFKETLDGTITYHDPCALGRGGGVYDQPRALLSSIPGIKFVEMKRNRKSAWCCGAGKGITRATDLDLSLEIALDRVAEAKKIDAQSLVTSCPVCKENMQEALKGRGGEAAVTVYDLVEMIAKSMGLPA